MNKQQAMEHALEIAQNAITNVLVDVLIEDCIDMGGMSEEEKKDATDAIETALRTIHSNLIDKQVEVMQPENTTVQNILFSGPTANVDAALRMVAESSATLHLVFITPDQGDE